MKKAERTAGREVLAGHGEKDCGGSGAAEETMEATQKEPETKEPEIKEPEIKEPASGKPESGEAAVGRGQGTPAVPEQLRIPFPAEVCGREGTCGGEKDSGAGAFGTYGTVGTSGISETSEKTEVSETFEVPEKSGTAEEFQKSGTSAPLRSRVLPPCIPSSGEDTSPCMQAPCGGAPYDPVELARRGLLFDLLALYIERCTGSGSRGKTASAGGRGTEKPAGRQTDTGKQSGTGKSAPHSRFPNVAGFCRFLGIGMAKLTALAAELPDDYDALCAVFEDEALNSGVSASLLTPYFKKRLGYGDRDREAVSPSGGYDDGTVRILFDHDVLEDGA